MKENLILGVLLVASILFCAAMTPKAIDKEIQFQSERVKNHLQDTK